MPGHPADRGAGEQGIEQRTGGKHVLHERIEFCQDLVVPARLRGSVEQGLGVDAPMRRPLTSMAGFRDFVSLIRDSKSS